MSEHSRTSSANTRTPSCSRSDFEVQRERLIFRSWRASSRNVSTSGDAMPVPSCLRHGLELVAPGNGLGLDRRSDDADPRGPRQPPPLSQEGLGVTADGIYGAETYVAHVATGNATAQAKRRVVVSIQTTLTE